MYGKKAPLRSVSDIPLSISFSEYLGENQVGRERGCKKKKIKGTEMQRARESLKRQSWWKQRWEWVYERDIDQLHTLAAHRLKLAVIIPVMQRDTQAQAPLNITYIQSSQLRFARLNSEVSQEIPAVDLYSWFPIPSPTLQSVPGGGQGITEQLNCDSPSQLRSLGTVSKTNPSASSSLPGPELHSALTMWPKSSWPS